MLPLSYIALALVMSVVLCSIAFVAIGKSTPDPARAKQRKMFVVGGLLLWHGYIAALGMSGFLADFSLPPRFPLLLVVPAFVFIAVFVARHRNAAWLDTIPPHWLVYYQSFRIAIESLFVWSVAQGILHPEVTVEGYNYDIVYAGITPFIAYLVFQKPVLPKPVAIAWNVIGLLVIAVIIALFITTIYVPSLWGSEVPLGPVAFTHYPYVVVAGFLMPSAVFVHALSLAQLTRTARLEKNDAATAAAV
jgi:hypothetical protein